MSLSELQRKGQHLAEEVIPGRFWISVEHNSDSQRKLPHVVSAGGRLVVSAKVVEVLRRFDLGETQLIPVPLLKDDRVTSYDGTWFLCNIRPKKEGFEPELSTGWRPPRYNDLEFLGTINPIRTKDDMVRLNSSVLEGPDIWLDPRVNHDFFVSDALARALRDENLLGKTTLVRCPVVTHS